MARKKKQDEESSDDLNNSDDTFGLPEIEYQPLQREETSEPASEYTSHSTEQPEKSQPMERDEFPRNDENTSYYMDDDNEPSPWPKILGIAAVLLVGALAWWYFGMYRPQQQEQDRLAREKMEEDARLKREADMAESRRLEAERRRADSLAQIAAVPPIGTIDTLMERTGRYYVIVASAIDGDLLVDYARKLTPKGISPKLIPPHGNVKFFRLAVDEGDTYASTQARADELKAEYTTGAWVVKY